MNRSIAQPPKERVHIAYRSKEDGAQAETELPLKMLVIGDFVGRSDATAIEERQARAVNKDNFDDVMRSFGLKLSIEVEDKLHRADGAADKQTQSKSLSFELAIEKLEDFSPEQLCLQSEPLRQLLQLRAALVALKGPLGNFPQFRRKLEQILTRSDLREQLIEELAQSAQAPRGLMPASAQNNNQET